MSRGELERQWFMLMIENPPRHFNDEQLAYVRSTLSIMVKMMMDLCDRLEEYNNIKKMTDMLGNLDIDDMDDS